jgi:uncharacterized membrane protein YcjF (UPF0283 family)
MKSNNQPGRWSRAGAGAGRAALTSWLNSSGQRDRSCGRLNGYNCGIMLKETVVVTVSTLLVNSAFISMEWSWHDKVSWVANLILAVVGFVGIIVAWMTLLKIERQTKAGEVAALAAKAGAEAALLNAQAVINAERAWIVIDVESPAPNQFNFVATNTGRMTLPSECVPLSELV